ncbi:iron-containing alcohol dehydrogenase [Aeromonas hydrophila]|uniref:iron-containing alcohol dehydrogenase n=1 Tax=Aeromonas hydrophila TaxID=644 RepID=UPI003EC82694
MAFALCLPQLSLSGSGAIHDLVQLMCNQPARRPLIVTERALISFGLLDGLLGALRDQGFTPLVYDGVEPNPTDKVASAALASWQAGQCDALIGFGGGSAMDTAKAVRALVPTPANRSMTSKASARSSTRAPSWPASAPPRARPPK